MTVQFTNLNCCVYKIMKISKNKNCTWKFPPKNITHTQLIISNPSVPLKKTSKNQLTNSRFDVCKRGNDGVFFKYRRFNAVIRRPICAARWHAFLGMSLPPHTRAKRTPLGHRDTEAIIASPPDWNGSGNSDELPCKSRICMFGWDWVNVTRWFTQGLMVVWGWEILNKIF